MFDINTAQAILERADTTDPKGVARVRAAELLANHLNKFTKLDRHLLRDAMEEAHQADELSGAWTWRDAYDAAEVAEVLVAQQVLANPRINTDRSKILAMLEALEALQPTARFRTEDSVRLQQFSTPISLAYLAFQAGCVTSKDMVLEPSAGHGHLALFARHVGAQLHMNELDPHRATALSKVFGRTITRYDATQIDDRLRRTFMPSIVLMNPPFSKSARLGDNSAECAEHVESAWKRLRQDGRLVAIVKPSFTQRSPSSGRVWNRLASEGRIVMEANIERGFFKSRGTGVETKLVVVDKSTSGPRGTVKALIDSTHAMHDAIAALPERPSEGPVIRTSSHSVSAPRSTGRPTKAVARPINIRVTNIKGEPVGYVPKVSSVTADADALYTDYEVARIAITDAKPHPEQLTQSSVLAAIRPPLPTYVPVLPRAVVADGKLSDAQLELIIYAGDAHSRQLGGRYTWDDETGQLRTATENEDGHTYRQGFFDADGTGCGKGRTVAGIILDNWCQGRKRHVWVSKSEALLEDAIRDWTALGGSARDVFAQSSVPYGKTIHAREGILFTTFATIRGEARDDRMSRLAQLQDWMGDGFEGVLAFDEAHAMQNSMAEETENGIKHASLQGKAGFDLQRHAPQARVVYASATAASSISDLAYADRLGLWMGPDAPFGSRSDFVASMTAGGVAAMEMICRDLKAMGLFMARNLSFDGVTYEFLDHELTDQQVEIYDAYAEAFYHIHHNLEAALRSTGSISDATGNRNGRAIGAAKSMFESTKQRFFNHLLTAMKMPTLFASIERDQEEGRASVIQIVSTGEAAMDRVIAQLEPGDIRDGNFDLTPRDTVIEYLRSSFPVQLFNERVGPDGNSSFELAYGSEGEPLVSREAEQLRDTLVQDLYMLPPVASALDQLIWHFGPDAVAEITGRSKRIVFEDTELGRHGKIEPRGASTKISETNAFMDDMKTILVFSEAGGTGRSYHADRNRKNQRPRVHYLLEAGWKADAAIQGLGRSHRTNQAYPPCFRPVSTDVKGEKRFLSTIARRLDALGALTKGERETGGQGMFRAEDNLESPQAREALLTFFRRLHLEPQGGISMVEFSDLTGLKLIDHKTGTLRQSLPPVRQFLNRLLALKIEQQNTLFEVFGNIIANRVEAAREAGTLDEGAEVITADSIELLDDAVLTTDDRTGAETHMLHLRLKSTISTLPYKEMLQSYEQARGTFVRNSKSGGVAFCQDATDYTDPASGEVWQRKRLHRPAGSEYMKATNFAESAWEPTNPETAKALWEQETSELPRFSEMDIGIVTGLILPVWTKIPSVNQTVYRGTTDCERSFLGRYVPQQVMKALMGHYGHTTDVKMTGASILSELQEGRNVTVNGNMLLKESRVMDRKRIELVGADGAVMRRLRDLGCQIDIIANKARLFVLSGPSQTALLETILDTYGGLDEEEEEGELQLAEVA